MKTPAERVISKFGGITALSKALGHEYPTTVQGWKERGVIPSRQMPAVMEAARKNGVPLDPSELIGHSVTSFGGD